MAAPSTSSDASRSPDTSLIREDGLIASTRMDKVSDRILAETCLKLMIGKAERGAVALEAIARHKAAYLVSKAIKAAKPVAFQDLGMEAIYELKVQDMPVTVAVDSRCNSIHKTGPAQWRRVKEPATAES